MRREFAFQVTIKASGENRSDMIKAISRRGLPARRPRDEARCIEFLASGVRFASGDSR
jgi:hypothetical protein